MNVTVNQSFKSLDPMGCYTYVIFDYEGELTPLDVLHQKYIAEMYRMRVKGNYFKKTDQFLWDIFGPLEIAHLKLTDFCLLNFAQITEKINSYLQDSNWGDDLPIFKLNFDHATNFLHSQNLLGNLFYYINMDDLNKDNLKTNHPSTEWFSYFVGIFTIDSKNKKVIVMDFCCD